MAGIYFGAGHLLFHSLSCYTWVDVRQAQRLSQEWHSCKPCDMDMITYSPGVDVLSMDCSLDVKHIPTINHRADILRIIETPELHER